MIKIISAYTPDYRSIIEITEPIINNYCSYHLFDHKIYQINPENYSRPPAWAKIDYLIKESIDEESKYLMWIDADTIILNSGYDLINLIEPNKYIYICKDYNNINTGVFILKNNNFTKDLLKKIWSMEEYVDHHWWEQGAFIKLVEQNWNNIKTYIKYIHNSELNSYLPEVVVNIRDNNQYAVNDNSFLLHIPGFWGSTGLEFRLNKIKEYQNKYIFRYKNKLNAKVSQFAPEFFAKSYELYKHTKQINLQKNIDLIDIMKFRFLQNIYQENA